MTINKIIGALAALALVAAACGSPTESQLTTTTSPGGSGSTMPPTTTAPGSFTPGELISLDLPRTRTDVSDDEVAAVIAGDRQFALDLFAAIAADENVMVSPYSIATALSMAYPGARGDTAAEIAEVLHVDVDDAVLHAVRSHIEALLATPPPPMGEEDTREPFTIRPANSAWGQGGYPFLDDYLAVLAESYGAGLQVLDYVGDPEGSREIINTWVEDITEDRIKNLIPQGSIDDLTRLVLVNAIWFKANWFEQFNPADTAPGQFTLIDGTTVDVPLMHAMRRTGYAKTPDFEAVRLPYAGDASMVILLPTSGTPSDLVATLTADDFDIEWGTHIVDVTLPSFEFEGEVPLKDALMGLGMVEAFSPGRADFSGIAEDSDLYISDAFHKTFIALDEQGTEAAAATALIVGATSAPPPATFTADRPFLFWIEHTPTGEPLFMGQVTNPAS